MRVRIKVSEQTATAAICQYRQAVTSLEQFKYVVTEYAGLYGAISATRDIESSQPEIIVKAREAVKKYFNK